MSDKSSYIKSSFDALPSQSLLMNLRENFSDFFTLYHSVNLYTLMKIIRDFSSIDDPDFSFDILVKFERINK